MKKDSSDQIKAVNFKESSKYKRKRNNEHSWVALPEAQNDSVVSRIDALEVKFKGQEAQIENLKTVLKLQQDFYENWELEQ